MKRMNNRGHYDTPYCSVISYQVWIRFLLTYIFINSILGGVLDMG